MQNTIENISFRKLEAEEVNFTASWKVGSLTNVTYSELVKIFGQPTYNEPSGDEKVQVEWCIEVSGDGFIYELYIYDYKTFDRNYTKNNLTTWSIGGTDKGSVEPLVLYVFAMQRAKNYIQ